MTTRTVSLKTYPCGTIVLEVITAALPRVEPVPARTTTGAGR